MGLMLVPPSSLNKYVPTTKISGSCELSSIGISVSTNSVCFLGVRKLSAGTRRDVVRNGSPTGCRTGRQNESQLVTEMYGNHIPRPS